MSSQPGGSSNPHRNINSVTFQDSNHQLQQQRQSKPSTSHRASTSNMTTGMNTSSGGYTSGNNSEVDMSKYILNPLKAEAEPNTSRPSDKYILDATKKSFRFYWDLVIFVALIYVATVSAFVIAFIGTLQVSNPFYWIERALDFLFLIDIVLNFFTVYYEYSNDHRRRRRTHKHIIISYLGTYFIFDIVSVLPWDMISNYDDDRNNIIEIFKYLRLVRMLKLFRLFRIARMNQSFTHIEKMFRVKHAYVRLFTLVVSISFILHWVACIFYLFGSTPQALEDSMFNSWLEEDGVPPDMYGRYILSLYFSVYTITTIGYGDVVPRNTFERTYVTIIMFFGASCFAWAIGQISNITSEMTESSTEYRMKMDKLLDLCYIYDIEDELSLKIRKSVQVYYAEKNVEDHNDILDILSDDLKLKVLEHLHGKYVEELRHVDEFRNVASLSNIYLSLEEKTFYKDERLYSMNDAPENMYIIKSGSVYVQAKQSFAYSETEDTTDDELNNGDSESNRTFGEGAIIGLREIIDRTGRIGDVIVTKQAKILVISEKGVLDTLRFNRALWKRLHAERDESLNNVIRDSLTDNDLSVPVESMSADVLRSEVLRKNEKIRSLQQQLESVKDQLKGLVINLP